MIVAAAIFHKGVVLTGVRHSEIFKDIVRLRPNTELPIKSPQGFINHRNKFLTRREALIEAVDCGQITIKENKKPHLESGVLTSEDLW